MSEALLPLEPYRPGLSPAACRALLQRRSAALREHFSPALAVRPLLEEHCATIDALIIDHFQRHALPAEVGLYAIGGYGRRELFPASDVDLLILGADSPALRAFIADLWACGLKLSQQVHPPAAVLDYARRDWDFLTSLLEARPLAGARYDLNGRGLVPAADYWRYKWAEQERRHRENFGRLEPDLKNGVGGLRDVHMVGWLERFSGRKVSLGPSAAKKYRNSINEMERLRLLLHLLDPKSRDILRFNTQRQLAARLGYPDEEPNRAIEALMHRYYRASRRIYRYNQWLLKQLHNRCFPVAEAEAIDGYFVLSHGQLNGRGPLTPARLWAALAHWQSDPRIRGLHPELEQQLLHERDRLFSRAQRARPETFAQFRRLLQRPPVAPSLEALHHYGLLHRLIPEFWAITGQMQYDLFHHYTVDSHTLRLLRQLDAFATPSEAYPEAAALWAEVPQRDLLYLAGLFHDIGKGQAGDHSVIGARIARRYGRRWLNREEAALLEFLVREHLTLSLTAQKQDINDPRVIAQFAAVVRSPLRLDLLYLLTLADISATNPSLWNGWRAQLLHRLYQRTRTLLLDRDSLAVDFRAQLDSSLVATLLPESRVLWRNLPDDFFLGVYTSDIVSKTRFLLQGDRWLQPLGKLSFMVAAPRPANGLFAHICHYLEQHNGDIVEARLYRSRDQRLTIQEFVLSRPLERPGWAEELEARLHRESPLPPLPKRLAAHQLAYFHPRVKIQFFQAGERTRLDLSCKDQHGLLSLMSRLLWQENIFISHAKISTLGERAEDAFYLSDEHQRPLSPARQARLKTLLQQALAGS